jgi:hypothetical protein
MSKLIIDGAKLDAAIVSVNKAANKLNDAIQVVLASAVYQAVYGRNTNHLNALVHAVGKGVRKAAIGAWIMKYAPVVPEADKEKAKEAPFRFSADKMDDLAEAYGWGNSKRVTAEEAMAYAELAMDDHWTEFKPDAVVPEEFDALAALKQVLARAQKMQDKGAKIKGMDVLRKLKDLVTSPGDVQSV